MLLLFQQFNVGSEALGCPVALHSSIEQSPSNSSLPDSIRKPEASTADTLPKDSLIILTNETEDNVLDSKVMYHARDSIRVGIQDETVHLYGAATVDYEDLHLKADYIVIDMNRKELFAEGLTDTAGTVTGMPEFSQGDQKFRSTSIRYNFQSRKGKIAYVITQEGEGFIHGEVVKKDPENNFYISKGKYTTCELDDPHFSITSNKLKVISKNKIVTGPAYLTIEGVPTPLLIPFGFFPNKKGRSSGIIFPAFGESAQRGFYFEHLGYYFGFNDYFNLAITSDVFTKGSYTLEAASIYKKRYKYSGNLKLQYAYTVDGDRELPGFASTKNFFINWAHSQDPKLNPNSTFSANVNGGSSSYYRNTISSLDNLHQNTFQSSITYSYNFPDKPMNYTVAVSHSQNTLTRLVNITAPQVSYNVSRINPFQRKKMVGKQRWYEKIGTSYSFRGTNYIEAQEDDLFKQQTLDEMKNGFQQTIPVSTSFNLFKFYNVSPSFNTTQRMYFKTVRYSWDADSNKVDTSEVKKVQVASDYQVSLGVATRMYGMYQFKGGPVTAVRHVLTPSASLSYRPDFGEEKFGYYKTVQTDSTGRTRKYSIFEETVYGGPASGPFANLGFSLDNNIEMKVKTDSDTGEGTKKIKILESLRISSGYNIIADSMKLDVFNISGRTYLLNKVSLTFGGVLNPYAFDENNNDYDRFMVSDGGRLVRLTSANVSMNFSLNRMLKKESEKFSKEELDYINAHPEEYIDFDIPFNLSVSYSFRYSKRGNLQSTKSQSASFDGDLSLTPQWKIGFNSWYDITEGRFTSLGLNFFRNLHCWEMRLGWIPFGIQESWNFQINVKSSILQDLKLLKRKGPFD